jgi:hypothetical protein
MTLLLLLAAGACTPDYPMDKAGTWSLPPDTLGSNDANLRTMLVNPHDLAAGTGEANSKASEAAPPVERLLSGRREQLPASNAAVFQIQSQPSAPTGGTPGGAGGLSAD